MLLMCGVCCQIQHWGYRAVPVSVATGQGMSNLAAALDGRISAVAGPSGVGKSSIINALRLRAQRPDRAAETAPAVHAERPFSQHAQHDAASSNGSRPAVSADSETPTMEASESHTAADQDDTAETQLTASSSQRKDETATASTSYHAHQRSSQQHKSNKANAEMSVSSGADSSAMAVAPANEHLSDTAHEDNSQTQSASQGRSQNGHSRSSSSSSSSSSSMLPAASANEAPAPAPSLAPAASADQAARQEEEQQNPQQLSYWRQRGAGGAEGAVQGLQLQSVGDMSSIGRGMHTTRTVALIEVRCLPPSL